MTPGYILALDQGTSSTRALVVAPDLSIRAVAQQELAQYYPHDGWVEHDAEMIWRDVLATGRAAIARAGLTAGDIAAIGIANQRETTVLWDRISGRAIHNAIVWQDRRTADFCAALRANGVEAELQDCTGLLLDPYFSGTKLSWLLDHVPDARRRAEAGELAFGTIDSFLIWRLTGGALHATDATNASRTLLANLKSGEWDEAMLRLFRIPRAVLPEIRDCAGDFGTTTADCFGAPISIRGVAGDQQAALIGQACFEPGMVKATYGTGCFALLNTGTRMVRSSHRLVSTVAYQMKGQRHYALEGSIFVAGAAVQWLRDGIGIISEAAEVETLAEAADPGQRVIMVPAFVGLGAPHWDSMARGAIFGLTRNTTRKELARAALSAVAHQTCDLLTAMQADLGEDENKPVIRVDGGMAASDWTMQHLADVLGTIIDRPKLVETTALGAAFLAGMQVGLLPSVAELTRQWALDRRFEPQMDEVEREASRREWTDALGRLLYPKVLPQIAACR